MKIEPKEYCGSVTIKKELIYGNGEYGYYKRNGKIFFRNYGHNLKNERGMTINRIIFDKIRHAA